MKLKQELVRRLEKLAEEDNVSPEEKLQLLIAKEERRPIRRKRRLRTLRRQNPELAAELDAVWDSQRAGFQYLLWEHH